ncbi:MAG: DUF2461 domain-containing protein [Ignavibacteriales bacterium]
MAYFNKDFLKFFSELEKNNNRDWFAANKDRYLYNVKIPFEFFVDEIIHMIQEKDDSIQITAREACFRIYRDVRFSKDKSPYKLFASAIISNKARKDLYLPGFYFEFSHKGINIYTGAYFLDKKQLFKVRKEIQNHLEEFNQLISDKNFKKLFGEVLGEKNKIIPKEFSETFRVQPLIANKEFYFQAKIDAKNILSKKLAELIMKYYSAASEINNFFIDAINRK